MARYVVRVRRGPIDLVYVMGWVSHLEAFWMDPAQKRFFRHLASFSRLILFDKRGTGGVGSTAANRLVDGRDAGDQARIGRPSRRHQVGREDGDSAAAGHRRGDKSDLHGRLTIHGSQHVHLSLDNRL